MKLKPSQIKPNPDNPRIIKDWQFKKLVKSLTEFPEMATVREVVVNKDYMILGGNMRFKAMVEAGWKEIPVRVVDWPEDKQREFIIKDNVSGGDWDYDLLANEWDSQKLDDWGLNLSQFNSDEAQRLNENEEWEGMPDYALNPYGYKIIIAFESKEDMALFEAETKLQIRTKRDKAWSTFWPYKERDDINSIMRA